jgi:hypothetical protein
MKKKIGTSKSISKYQMGGAKKYDEGGSIDGDKGKGKAKSSPSMLDKIEKRVSGMVPRSVKNAVKRGVNEIGKKVQSLTKPERDLDTCTMKKGGTVGKRMAKKKK